MKYFQVEANNVSDVCFFGRIGASIFEKCLVFCEIFIFKCSIFQMDVAFFGRNVTFFGTNVNFFQGNVTFFREIKLFSVKIWQIELIFL